MRTLRVVDASFNNLTSVGGIFDSMPALQTLNLNNNPDLDEKTMSDKCSRFVTMVRFNYFFNIKFNIVLVFIFGRIFL